MCAKIVFMDDKNAIIFNKEYANTKKEAFDKGSFHLSYKTEMNFYDLVKQGNIEELETNKPKLIVKGQGILSDDKFRNLQYHFVIATALIVRFCIEGGLPKENAYTLSDIFIRKMDKLWEQDEIEKLHYEMVITFAKEMRNLKKKSGSSLYIRKTIDFISSHYNTQIKVSKIADKLGLSEKYLSSLFKKETGSTIISFIEQTRIEEACRLLTYTDTPYADIADCLCFNSHSYFVKVFKKNKGLTPMQYRIKQQPQKFSLDE